MTEISTRRAAPFLALAPLLALLLAAGGCSDQQSSAPTAPPATGKITEKAMEPAPAVTTVELSKPAEAPAAMPAEAPAPAATMAAAAADGEEVYNKACKTCHAAGVAGAPKLGDSAAWAPRLAKGEEALVGSVKNGLNAMPPKGACMTCSDDELKSAVQYMLGKTG
ncbi:MAG: c-type cytochrome [Gammaproteobacteria bacterium]